MRVQSRKHGRAGLVFIAAFASTTIGALARRAEATVPCRPAERLDLEVVTYAVGDVDTPEAPL